MAEKGVSRQHFGSNLQSIETRVLAPFFPARLLLREHIIDRTPRTRRKAESTMFQKKKKSLIDGIELPDPENTNTAAKFLHTGCFGTQVGLSPLLILSISSARSLVCVLPPLFATTVFLNSDIDQLGDSTT